MRVPTSHSTTRISPLTQARTDVMSCLTAVTPARTKALPSRTNSIGSSHPTNPTRTD